MAGPLDEPQQEIDPNTGRVIVVPEVTPPSNAETPATQSDAWYDAGIDAPTRTLEQTQSMQYGDGDPYVLDGQSTIPAYGDGDPYVLDGQSTIAPLPPLTNVAVSGSEDSGKTTTTKTQQEVNASSNAPTQITPQPNVLDKFGSYTYNASVYLMTPEQYQQMLQTKKKQISGYQLLFQTGGAPNNTSGPKGSAGANVNEGRNPYFTEDFYIDSVTMENALPGKVTGAAHMVTDLKFTVVEPGNISLLDRLYSAVQDFVAKNGNGAINYTAVTYMMVIRFYGYDQAGNLIGGPSSSASGTQPVIEKYIPFIINGIDWTVGTKLVSYDFKCSPTGQLIAGSTSRGTIPYDVEFSASSVKDLLSGDLKYSGTNANPTTPGAATTSTAATTYDSFGNPVPAGSAAASVAGANNPAPATAAAAPNKKKTLTAGLMGAINEYQLDLVKAGTYKFPDEYAVEFLDPEIQSATIVLPGANKNKAATPMAQPTTQNPKAIVTQQATDHSIRNFSLTAGQQILQAIELILRNSSYVNKQANSIKNEEEGTQEENTTSNANKPLDWFQITMESIPKKDQYDDLRNDYAYKVTYKISRYKVPNFESRYFPVAKFPGVHKSYNYWFTGQNTAVLDYTANFNSLYSITVTGDSPKNSGAAAIKRAFTSSMRDLPKFNYMAASTESRIGAKNQGNEIASNAAEYLYDPSSLGEVKMRIIGDPAWIQQGSLFAGVTGLSPFLADGTINFDAMQVLFEIAWQRPEDYSLSTGLADPYSRTQKITGDRQPIQSYVYQATKVISEFKQGKFEQTLEGSLYIFPKPDGTNTAPGAPNKGPALTNSLDSEKSLTGTAAQGLFNGATSAVQNALAKIKGVIAAPGPTETAIPNQSPTYADYDIPVVGVAPPAGEITSNGEATVADFYSGEPPPKIGEDNGPSSDPPQEMAIDP